MIEVNKLKSDKVAELKRVYNLTGNSIIPVRSNFILGQYSLLSRHKEGNESRIIKLKEIISANSKKTSLANIIEMSLEELLEVYDLSKNIDQKSIADILSYNQYMYDERRAMCRLDSRTIQLPQIQQVEVGTKLYLDFKEFKVPLEEGVQYTIGRDISNAIHVEDTMVSRKHCEIYVVGQDKTLIHDLESTNGTYINGRPLKGETLIKAGDVIKIGNVQFLLQKR